MRIDGTIPSLPPPLSRWNWLIGPMPAERLAAWRIGTGIILIVDLLLFYLPNLRWFYGPNSLAEPGIFTERFASPNWNWSVLNWLPVAWGPQACFAIWVGAAVMLIVGWQARVAAAIGFIMSLSFYNTNFFLHNSGDRIRHFLLLLLIVAPSDAVWSLAKRKEPANEPVFVSAWPARLMLIQMCAMYFMNGLYKMFGRIWWDGSVMHYLANDYAWARWSALAVPVFITQILAWFTLLWEAGFPLWVLMRRTRTVALLIGVTFHLLTFFYLELAAFPLYALCLYFPLAPWEKLRRGEANAA
jgi:HTTM domain